MRTIITFLFFLLAFHKSFAQEIATPLEKNNYQKVTSYGQMISYLQKICNSYKWMRVDFIGESTEGRKIPVVEISNSETGKDTSKIKILIFAQQHGNEQSGKEGALLLLKEIGEGKLDYLFEKVDLLIIPQMNPDGSEKNKRQNGNGKDLNRNHLTLSEPGTRGLHNLYNKFLPEATLDVHEYYPYGESWKKFGYIKYFDEQFGTATNPNVSKKIREYSKNEFLPFIINYLYKIDFTANEYLLGGPPPEERMRYSTYDINDGRQSFGSLNNFSFILEGRNGSDGYIENLEHRTKAQAASIEGFIEFIYQNKNKIKRLVENEREKIVSPRRGEQIAIRMEHIGGNFPVKVTFHSLRTGKDSIISVNNFDQDDKIILAVDKPAGYLVPQNMKEVIELLDRQKIKYEKISNTSKFIIQKYHITRIDSIKLEETELPDPEVKMSPVNYDLNLDSMIFVPVNQLYGNVIVQALEPQSMFGLATYNTVYGEYKDFIKENYEYPILRVLWKKNN